MHLIQELKLFLLCFYVNRECSHSIQTNYVLRKTNVVPAWAGVKKKLENGNKQSYLF